MAALQTPAGGIGWHAPDFTLKDAYGNQFRLFDLKGLSGTLVMFICNHCPYVRTIADRIARDAFDLQKRGVGVIAVMPNDYVRYPDDAPDKMQRFAQKHNFTFPYVVDETQEVAQPMTRSAPPTSSVSTPPWSCNIAAGWMHRAPHSFPTPVANCRGNVSDRRDRQGAGGTAAEHGLLDQVAGVVGLFYEAKIPSARLQGRPPVTASHASLRDWSSETPKHTY